MLRLWPYAYPLFLLLACGPAPKPTPPAAAPFVPLLQQELPIDLQINTGTLDNGLRYFIRPNQNPRDQIELHLIIQAGSVYEADDQQGMAHFIEHMAFGGTKTFTRTDLEEYFNSIDMRFGAHTNASTRFDATVYTIKVPTNDFSALETALQILQDWAHQIRFDVATVEAVRNDILAEARSGLDGGSRIQDKQLPVLLKGTRYAERLRIGQEAQIDTFSAASLARFYRHWYRPERMTLIAVGDFSEEILNSMMRQYMGAIPTLMPIQSAPVDTKLEHQETRFSINADPEISRSSVSIYFTDPIPLQHQIQAYRRFILRNLCTRLFNHRLAELVHQHEPPYLQAGAGTGILTGTIERYQLAAVVPDNRINAGLAALLTEIKRVQQHGFTAAELAQQKELSLHSIERAYNDRDQSQSPQLAAELMRHVLHKEPIPGIVYEYGLHKTFMPKITLEEINQTARLLTNDHNRTILAVSPQKKGVSKPTIADLSEVITQVEQTAVKPYKAPNPPLPLTPNLPPPGAVVAIDSITALGLTEWTLSNGIKVWLKPTAFNPDEVLFSGFSLGGHSLVSNAEYISAFTAAALVQRSGVGTFSAKALDAQLAEKNVSIAVQINELRQGLSGGSSPQDLETLLQLIYLHATAPRRDPEAFAAYRAFLEQALAQRHNEPVAVLNDTLQHILAQDHYRARLWTVDILQEMDLDTSLRIYRERFANMGDFTFFFVGNFQLDQIRPLIERYLAILPATGQQLAWRDVGMNPPEGIVEKSIYAGEDSLSRTQLIFSGPLEWSQEKTYLLHSMVSVLRFQLHQALQTELGASPALRTGASVSRFPTPTYKIAISFDALPKQADTVTQLIFAQIDLLKSVATAEAHIIQIKESQSRQYRSQSQLNSYWLNALENAFYHNTDPLEILDFGSFINGLNAGKIMQSAKHYLDMNRYIRTTLYPIHFNEN